jgi:putative transposase
MILERGIVVSYETIRRWCRPHDTLLTTLLRRKTPSASDVWHLDEVVVRIGSKKC